MGIFNRLVSFLSVAIVLSLYGCGGGGSSGSGEVTGSNTTSSSASTSSTSSANSSSASGGSSSSASSGTSSSASSTTSATYSIGGAVSGLTGTLVLQNNGGNNLSISQNGQFAFSGQLMTGAPYSVTVLSKPSTQSCTVASSSGTIASANITSVAVSCVTTAYTVGGTASGLAGPIEIQNGSDLITISQDGAFTFPQALGAGASYAVSISQQQNHKCVVLAGSGAISGANVTNVSVACSAKSARFRPESYSSFNSSLGVGNLEGTWVLLGEGTLTYFRQIAGVNPREDYQLWSRAVVRLRRDPGNSSRYFIFNCGPGGAANTAISTSAIYIPFYYFGTSTYLLYGATVVDATTMRIDPVSQNLVYVAGDLSMGWSFAWTLKRISDDPFAAYSSVTDMLATQVTSASCIYESEGPYLATENDGVTTRTVGNGLSYRAEAYPFWANQLFTDVGGYDLRFSIWDLAGYKKTFRTGSDIFATMSGDSIGIVKSYSGTSSRYSVGATNAGATDSADDQLDISF